MLPLISRMRSVHALGESALVASSWVTTAMCPTSRTALCWVPAAIKTGAPPHGNTIVGLYSDMAESPPATHGYVLENGNFQSFDVPSSTLKFTEAWDINPDGNIVGDFQDGAGMFHGFLRTVSGYTSIDFPAATATHAQGINPGGAIVGTYTDTNKVTHGFLAVPVSN